MNRKLLSLLLMLMFASASLWADDASLPFVESFDTNDSQIPPVGWTTYKVLLSDVLNGTTKLSEQNDIESNKWRFNTSNAVFDQHARCNIHGFGCYDWLVTPTLQIEGHVSLTFDLALTSYSGDCKPIRPDVNPEDDKFVVLITTDGGTTWTILRQWDNAGSEDVFNDIAYVAGGEPVSIDLGEYSGKSIAIAFYGESTESNGDNNIHIDNVCIGEIPESVAIDAVASDECTDDAWYTLAGVKLQGKPTVKGVYLYQGKAVLVK